MTTPKVADKTADRNAGPITPRNEWVEVLRQAAFEVFSTMVGATLDAPVGDASASGTGSPDISLVAYVTGMIGIAGAVRAVFSLRCSDHAANRIASQMLAIPLNQAAAQKSDAIGEVCNMIAGHFKHTIGHGFSCTLTVPTVVVGGNYSIHCLEKGERIEFPLVYEGETMLITLDIRN